MALVATNAVATAATDRVALARAHMADSAPMAKAKINSAAAVEVEVVE